MERPPPPRLLLHVFLLVAVYWPLGTAAGIGGLGVGPEIDGSSFSSRNFRRLLQIGGGNEGGLFLFPHTRAPSHKNIQHRKASTSAPAPVSALSPSPFISPSEGSPSPYASRPMPRGSPSHHHPSVVPPHLVRPRPTTRQAEHDHSAETPAHSSHKHSWTTYSSVAAGIAVSLLVVSAAGVLCFRAKRMGTVRPWVTGLSGQLQKAFVTGVPALKRSELETACEDFSNIIGSTSSCMLYKGILSSGVEIALASSLVPTSKDWSKESESQ